MTPSTTISDFDDCADCGQTFDVPDAYGNDLTQHPRLFMLCRCCGDLEETAQLRSGTASDIKIVLH